MLPIRKALAASTLALVPLALAASPAAAVPAAPTLVVTSPAYLNAQGEVLLKVEVTCQAGTDGTLSASVQQVRQGVQSFGQAGRGIACTGATQTVWFTIEATFGPDFRTGRAYAQASAGACDTTGCGTFVQDEDNIRIRN